MEEEYEHELFEDENGETGIYFPNAHSDPGEIWDEEKQDFIYTDTDEF